MKNILSGRYFISVYSIEYVRVNTMPFDYSGNNFSAETMILKKVVTELGAVTITSKKPLIVKTILPMKIFMQKISIRFK